MIEDPEGGPAPAKIYLGITRRIYALRSFRALK